MCSISYRVIEIKCLIHQPCVHCQEEIVEQYGERLAQYLRKKKIFHELPDNQGCIVIRQHTSLKVRVMPIMNTVVLHATAIAKFLCIEAVLDDVLQCKSI